MGPRAAGGAGAPSSRTPPHPGLTDSPATPLQDAYSLAMRARSVRKVSLVLVLGAILGLGVRLAYVHAHTWEWSLTPSATSPKLEYVNRTYLRGSMQLTEPDGVATVGRTLGGGAILAAPNAANVPTIVYVRSNSRVTAYTLSGGP